MQMPPMSAPRLSPCREDDDEDEGDQDEVQPDRREHGKQRRHHAGGEPDEGRVAGEGDEEDARHRNAHQHGGLAVLHGGANRLAEIGRLQQEAERQRAGDRDEEADQQLGLGIERPDAERASAQHGRHVEQVGREHHQRQVLHEDRQSHGGEHHDEVRLVEARSDDEVVDQHPEQEHPRHDRQHGDERVEPEERVIAQAPYMAIIRNSPWAKLTMRSTPKISVRPMLINA